MNESGNNYCVCLEELSFFLTAWNEIKADFDTEVQIRGAVINSITILDCHLPPVVSDSY